MEREGDRYDVLTYIILKNIVIKTRIGHLDVLVSREEGSLLVVALSMALVVWFPHKLCTR